MSSSQAAQSAPEAEHRPDFRTLYRQRGRYVRGTLARLNVPERHLEDAAQDVWLVVLVKLPTYTPQGKMLAWLAFICLNVAAKYREKEARDPVVEQPVLTSDASLSEEQIADRELALHLIHQIKDPERRLAFCLYYLDGVTALEIGNALGIPAGSAWTRIRLARAEFEVAARRLKARERRQVGNLVIPVFGAMHLLASERTHAALPTGFADRVWRRILEAPEGRAVYGDLPAPVRWYAAVRAVIGASLFVAGVALGVLVAPLRRPASHVRIVPELTAAGTAPTSPPPAAAPAPTPPPPPEPRVAASAAGVAVPSPPSAIHLAEPKSERAVLDRAMHALDAGNPSLCISTLQEHAGTFRLAETRDAIWIRALVRAGRKDEARERVERFVADYPKSPYEKEFSNPL